MCYWIQYHKNVKILSAFHSNCCNFKGKKWNIKYYLSKKAYLLKLANNAYLIVSYFRSNVTMCKLSPSPCHIWSHCVDTFTPPEIIMDCSHTYFPLEDISSWILDSWMIYYFEKIFNFKSCCFKIGFTLRFDLLFWDNI